MPLPILPIAQLIYGGFNPYGTSKQPAIALGRSIAHGFGSGTGTPLGSGNIDFGTPSDNNPFGGGYGGGLSPSDIAQYAPAPYQPQPFIQPGDTNVPPPPGHFAVPQGPVTMPYGSGPNYVDPRSANAFFAGLQSWNTQQANPTGSETAAWQEQGAMPGWMAHKMALLAASGRGGGKGAAGVMPVRNQ